MCIDVTYTHLPQATFGAGEQPGNRIFRIDRADVSDHGVRSVDFDDGISHEPGSPSRRDETIFSQRIPQVTPVQVFSIAEPSYGMPGCVTGINGIELLSAFFFVQRKGDTIRNRFG